MRKSVGLAIALLLIAGCSCYASPAQESVAEAARKAREQKKSQARSAKVFTNDDLSTVAGRVNVVGTPAAPPETPGKEAAVPKEAATPEDTSGKPKEEEGEAYWRKRFAEARTKLRTAERELDVLQRELNLMQQQYYTDPSKAMLRQYDRKDINEHTKKIADKKQEVDRHRQGLSDLEDELRQAGGDPGWAREP